MIKSAPRLPLRMREVRLFNALIISIANNFACLFDIFLDVVSTGRSIFFLQRSASIFNRITSKYLSAWQKINFLAYTQKSVDRISVDIFSTRAKNQIIMRFRVSVSYNFKHTMTKMIDKCFLHRQNRWIGCFLPCTSRFFCALLSLTHPHASTVSIWQFSMLAAVTSTFLCIFLIQFGCFYVIRFMLLLPNFFSRASFILMHTLSTRIECDMYKFN